MPLLLLLSLALGRLVAPGPPDWVAPAPGAFPEAMAITGVVQVSGVELRSSSDRVAAFVDGEIRGVAAPTLSGGRRIFLLTVAGATGEGPIAFRAYNAAADQVIDLQPDLAFASLSPVGTLASPLVWTPLVGGGAPAWSPPPGAFDLSMNVTARVFQNGAPVADAVVGAFVGGQARGAAPVQTFGTLGTLAFLGVGADAGETGAIAFRVYLPSTDRTYTVTETVALVPGGSTGSPGAPTVLTIAPGPTLRGVPGWRMLAPAGADATLDLALGSVWTQGFPGAGAPAGDPTVYRYDEPTGTYGTPATSGEPWARGTGRFVYVFADDDPLTSDPDNPFPKTLPSVGIGPSGPFAFALTRTPGNGEPAGPGWNLLGNPFDEAIDWDAGWTRTGVSNSVYVWDPNASGGTYLVWNGSVGGLTGGVIPAGNAFWAEATADGAALSVPTAARVGAAVTVGRQAGAHSVALRLASEARPGLAADAFLSFQSGATGPLAEADPFDAWVLDPLVAAHLTLGSGARPDGRLLAIDARPPLDEGRAEVPFAVGTAGWAQATDEPLVLTWPALDVPEAWRLTLVDTQTGSRVDLRAEGAYRFAAPAAPASARSPLPGEGSAPTLAARGRATPVRFLLEVAADHATAATPGERSELSLGPAVPNPSSGRVALTLRLPEAGPVRLALYDVLGRRVLTLAQGPRAAGAHTVSLDGTRLPAGVYTARLDAGGGTRTIRLTILR